MVLSVYFVYVTLTELNCASQSNACDNLDAASCFERVKSALDNYRNENWTIENSNLFIPFYIWFLPFSNHLFSLLAAASVLTRRDLETPGVLEWLMWPGNTEVKLILAPTFSNYFVTSFFVFGKFVATFAFCDGHRKSWVMARIWIPLKE